MSWGKQNSLDRLTNKSKIVSKKVHTKKTKTTKENLFKQSFKDMTGTSFAKTYPMWVTLILFVKLQVPNNVDIYEVLTLSRKTES